MSDLISRQAVIEAMEQTYCDIERVKKRPVTNGEQAIFLDMRGVVRSFPSVESEKCGDCTEHPCLGKLCIYYKQPCEDCISRQAAKSKAVYSHERHEKVVPVAELDWLPSVEPKRKKGHWIMQNDRSKKLLGWSFCSECNAWIGEPTDYCSNCGADMRG